MRDFLRQGVDFGGNARSKNFVARRISELMPWRIVTAPGGSTVHVEIDSAGSDLRNVTITDCVVNHSIAASVVASGLTIENNDITGSLITNLDGAPVVIRNNFIRSYPAGENRSMYQGSMFEMLAPQNAIIENNTLIIQPGSLQEIEPPSGLMIEGGTRYCPLYAQNLTITGNRFVGKFTPKFRNRVISNGAINLDGVDGVVVTNSNTFLNGTLKDNVCECCRYGGVALRCKNVTIG